MNVGQVEGLLVLTLFLGYLYLWWQKRMIMLIDSSTDPDVIYRDERPSQKLFAKLSRLLSLFIGLLIFLQITGFNGHFENGVLFTIKHKYLYLSGYAIGIFGLLLCWRAQKEMGRSWRVGIDRKRTELITTGVFKKIRNPTYSGLFLICLGTLMIIHNTLILLWVVTFYISIEFQVRIEEEHLMETHGQAYIDYLKTTKRYFPYLY
ncbi:methyltransferase family protein [Desulfosarcina widdelii]|uniref:methyltransferase family protein n=1 Tax=Desulfosarcina widdelii TaxID=947919 RepID=UPI0012D2FF33|nr:isoprenylcysteine carboxylmethyltransferase family protein [Desulfosarcina widdelii]